ncbi:MAG: O-antigen ligase family protein [Hyphomonadaceae bacterium]
MSIAAPASATPAKPRRGYRQVDLLRDFTVGFYLVYMLTGGLQRLIFGGGADGSGGGSLINQAITVLLLGIGLVCVLYERISYRKILHGAAPFIVPLVLIVLSLAWADYFAISTRRVLRFCIEVAAMVLLVSCYRDSRAFLRTFWCAFAILLVLDVLALAVPSMSFTSIGYAGIHGHKNMLGSYAYAAIPIFYFGWRLRLLGSWSFISVVFMLIGFALLAISWSKTAAFLVPFSALAGYLVYRVWRRGLTTQMALTALFILSIVVLTVPLWTRGMNLAEYVGMITGDPTMTGRTGVWEYTFWRVGDRQLTGVGYGSFWDVNESTVALMNQFGVTFAFNQSHNGYIGVFAELGWLGVGAIVFMWITATAAVLRRVGNRKEWPLVSYAIYTAIGYALYNVTETSFFRVGFDTWNEYVLIMAATAKLVPPPAPVARQRQPAAAVRPRQQVTPPPQRPRPRPIRPRLSGGPTRYRGGPR